VRSEREATGDDRPEAHDDRTARARIRDAALEAFGALGYAGASLRVVAAGAGVSQPLILHHFGSKEGLRTACDEYVAAIIREGKQESVAEGPGIDALAALRRTARSRVALRYLARSLTDGSPGVASLVDELVHDAEGYTEEAVRTGMMRPGSARREVVVVLTLWSLGGLVLHEHVERLLGVDLLGDPEQFGPYMTAAAEVLGGVLTDDVVARIRSQLTTEEHAP
jgi:AcrR family transcriptional regulator